MNSTSVSLSQSSGSRSDKAEFSGWMPIAALVFFTFAGLAVHAGILVNYLFPVLSLGVGALLFFRDPSLYVGFVLWQWLLAPEVRRLVDFEIGFQTQSPTQLAPFLVTGLCVITIFRKLPSFSIRRYAPFGMVLGGILYGYLVGIFNSGLFASTYDLLGWLTPVAMAFHMAQEWRRYPYWSKAFVKAAIWGLVVIGGYGLIQFFYLPPWDAYWLLQSKLKSNGTAEALGVRVFGTLNSSGPYAVAVASSLIYVFAGKRVLPGALAVSVGLPALAVSLVRSSWGSFLLGLMIFFSRLKGVAKTKFIIGAAFLLITSLPILTIGPLMDKLSARLNTLSNLEGDASFNARKQLYAKYLETALLDPLGEGLGSSGTAARLSTGTAVSIDSGLLLLPYTLGWLGGSLYLSGLMWLAASHLIRRPAGGDKHAVAAMAVALPLLAQMIFANVIVGVTGVWFWSAIGIVTAHSQWQKAALRPK